MDEILLILPFVLLFLLLALGVPVAFSLGISGFVCLLLGFGLPTALGYLQTTPYRQASHFGLAALPLFMLMGYAAGHSRITHDLFNAAYVWIGRLPGGLAQATVFASAIFAACSGSSIASAAILAPVVIPQMERFNYDKKLAVGTVAASGTLAIMIPPSLAFITYAFLTGLSVSKLFIAGILPGILTAIMFMASIHIRVKLNPALAPVTDQTTYTFRQKIASLTGVLPILLLVLVVLGGIYLGVMTPTEAGAVGAVGAIVIGLVNRQIGMNGIKESLAETVKASAMVFIIIIGAFIFGYFITIAKIPNLFIELITALSIGKYVILGLIVRGNSIIAADHRIFSGIVSSHG